MGTSRGDAAGDGWAGLTRGLAENGAMRRALRAFCQAGGVVLAQSAGLAYLSTACSVEGCAEQLPMGG